MSIPPVSNINIAASIAGTDRAAGTEVASGRAKGGGGAGPAGTADSIVEQAEKVTKSDLSGDSDADGRQMLDTFEQHGRDDAQPQDNTDDQETPHNGLPLNSDLIFNRPTLGGHIDLCG